MKPIEGCNSMKTTQPSCECGLESSDRDTATAQTLEECRLSALQNSFQNVHWPFASKLNLTSHLSYARIAFPSALYKECLTCCLPLLPHSCPWLLLLLPSLTPATNSAHQT